MEKETIMIDGVRYYADRPNSCRGCFFWKNRKAGCAEVEKQWGDWCAEQSESRNGKTLYPPHQSDSGTAGYVYGIFQTANMTPEQLADLTRSKGILPQIPGGYATENNDSETYEKLSLPLT